MERRWTLKIAAVAVAIAMAASTAPLEARSAKGTRPGKGSGSSASAGGRATGAARSPSGSARRAAGQSTYGRWRGLARHFYYDPYAYWLGSGWYGRYDPWYRYPYWSVGLTWGWPYGYWYPPVYAPVSPERVAVELTATIETDVRPRNAVVLLDGVEAGYAKDYDGRWDVLRVGPGTRRVAFVKEGYRSLEVTVHAAPGRDYVVSAALERGDGREPEVRTIGTPPRPRAPDRGERPPETRLEAGERGIERGFLRFRVTPDDAAVYLDGDFLANAGELGRLHGAIAVAEGEHVVEVVRPGFASKEIGIVVKGTTDVTIDLDPEP